MHVKSKWNEVYTFKDSQNFLPDKFSEFLQEARIILFVATRSQWSVPAKSNSALSQLSKTKYKMNKILPHYITYTVTLYACLDVFYM